MKISDAHRIHMVGIGGIGLSALAQLLAAEGKTVTGCDRGISEQVKAMLEGRGIVVHTENSAAHISNNTELVVYSDAVLEGTEGYAEREEARRRGISEQSYFEALGAIANRYYLIAVAGAHGKTTTTAMITDVLEAAGLDPTAVIGSLRTKTKSNFRLGKSKYFVVEADEWKRHLLEFMPDILVITNIDADHLDYYKDLGEIQSAFNELARKVPEEGYIVCNRKDPALAPVLEKVSAAMTDYTAFVDPLLQLKVPGMHNLMDAACALAVVSILGIEAQTAKEALREFSGTWRRFQYLGTSASGALVYDDYGHHPAEISATLKGARELFPTQRIIAVFHPHLYSRTKFLFGEFAHAFDEADEVVIAPIFAAREEPDPEVSSQKLAEAIAANGVPARAMDSFDEIESYLEMNAKEGDVVLTIGAGDIYKVAEALVEDM